MQVGNIKIHRRWDCNLSDDNDHDDHYGEEEFETQFDGIKVKLSSPVWWESGNGNDDYEY